MPNPSQQVSLGHSGLQLSQLGLGTEFLGGLLETMSEDRFEATILRALDWQITYYDTAPLYRLSESATRLVRSFHESRAVAGQRATLPSGRRGRDRIRRSVARRAEGPWPITPEMREKARGIEAVCFRHGVPLKAAALQFPLRHPVVACVLCGATTPEEMDENARLMQVAIPDATWVELQAEGLITNSSLLGGALDLNHAA